MFSMRSIRPPAVAGLFYPDDAAVLRRDIQDRIGHPKAHLPTPCALLVPHAGYVYSADIAASAYRLLAGGAAFERILLLGPAHRVAFRGFALPSVVAFHTPLGDVLVNEGMRQIALGLSGAVLDDAPHAQEHSLEVQLPFIQTLLPQCSILPIVVGDARREDLVRLIATLWDEQTLVILSSDFSHYSPYADAQRHDAKTMQHILAAEPLLNGEDACGCHALNALLVVAKARGLVAQQLDLRNSGDTAGDRVRVVGYGAVAWFGAVQPSTLSVQQKAVSHHEALGAALLQLARLNVAATVGIELDVDMPDLPELHEAGSTFVTLEREGRLRGCVGSIASARRLLDDVAHNARAAATQDWRFAPLSRAEWAGLRIEVSLLSRPAPFEVTSEQDACDQLVPLRDGVILEYHHHRATFLPQVWESLPEPRDFLAQLKLKAGLSAHFWSPEIRLQRYQVERWQAAEEVEP
ncbi:AmmeMemoRadiSam system protein B [Chitinibacter bivalviorum]|uniref:MEMO1 family protein HQ393_12325 n=1 Tax=Chitinibacter bivalviorum TaxID=2739434 RepID=A0A7H9BL20_9NEIS|nr:AmmeMemoRadiSam system protein B [Chitinibacter bivalviorum]QLG88958.1 AmmeMemoRadiSam system protein B [Chitinibacter bivalviorum]